MMEKATSIALMETAWSAGMGTSMDKATFLASMKTTKACQKASAGVAGIHA